MPTYQYKARGEEGRLITGRMSASGETELQSRLERNGFYLVSCSVERLNILEEDIINRFLPITQRSLYTVTLQLANTVETGMPLLVSLRAIADNCKNKKLERVLKAVIRDLESGSSFSEALNKHPSVFSKFYTSMVELGEASGTLPKILSSIAAYIKREIEIKRKIVSAMIYPLILTIVGLGIVVYILTNILPTFIKIFEESEVTLPLPTVILVAISNFLTQYWYILIGLLVGLAVSYRFFVMTEYGRFTVDKLKLRIWLIGEILKKVSAKRFIDSLNLLYTGGLPILSALNIVRSLLGNRSLEKMIDALWVHISKGKELASYLAMTDFFPPDILAMIRSGEESGSLGKMLEKASAIYEDEVNYAIEIFISAFEIFIILALGVGVGFIAMAILFPIMRLSQVVAAG
jgi:type IV pilus assembly protein PilC